MAVQRQRSTKGTDRLTYPPRTERAGLPCAGLRAALGQPEQLPLVVPTVPELVDARLVLRGWQLAADHIRVVLAAASDRDIARYSTVGSVSSPAGAEQWIRSQDAPDRLDWAITHSHEIFGRVSLAHIDSVHGIAEVGYWLLPTSRGQGLATAPWSRPRSSTPSERSGWDAS